MPIPTDTPPPPLPQPDDPFFRRPSNRPQSGGPPLPQPPTGACSPELPRDPIAHSYDSAQRNFHKQNRGLTHFLRLVDEGLEQDGYFTANAISPEGQRAWFEMRGGTAGREAVLRIERAQLAARLRAGPGGWRLTAAEIELQVSRELDVFAINAVVDFYENEFAYALRRPAGFPAIVARDFVPRASLPAIAEFSWSADTFRFTGRLEAAEAWNFVHWYRPGVGYVQDLYLVNTATQSYLVPSEFVSLVPIGEGGFAASVPTREEMIAINQARMAQTNLAVPETLGRASGPRPTPTTTFSRRLAGRSLSFLFLASNVLLYYEYLDWVVRQHPGGEEGLWVGIFGRGPQRELTTVGPLQFETALEFADGVRVSLAPTDERDPEAVRLRTVPDVTRTGLSAEAAIPLNPGERVCGTSNQTEIYYEMPVTQLGSIISLESASGGGVEGVELEIYWQVGFLVHLATLSSTDIPNATYTNTRSRGESFLLRLVSTVAPFSFCFFGTEPGEDSCHRQRNWSVGRRGYADIPAVGQRWWGLWTDFGQDDFCATANSLWTITGGEIYLLANITGGTNPTVKLVEGRCANAERGIPEPTAIVSLAASGCGSGVCTLAYRLAIVAETESAAMEVEWVTGYGPCPGISITTPAQSAVLTAEDEIITASVTGRGVTQVIWEYSVSGAGSWTTIESMDTSAESGASFSASTTWDVSGLDPGEYDLRAKLSVQGVFGPSSTVTVQVPGPVTPGVDCASAVAIDEDGLYGPLTLTSGDHWFKVTAAAGTNHVTVNITDLDGTAGLTIEQNTCETPDQVFAGSIGLGLSCAAGTFVNGEARIKVSLSSGTSVTYTVMYSAGACP